MFRQLGQKMKDRVLNEKNTKILTTILVLCYIGSIIYGIYRFNYPVIGDGHTVVMDKAQAKLVIMQSICASIVALMPYLLLKIFNIKLSFLVNVAIQVFTFCGIFLGETCLFYYKYQFWDKILHSISGVGVAFVGFAIVSNLIKDTNVQHKMGASFAIAFLIALSGGMIHELYEFAVDVLNGTNMQKSIPHFWTGGNTKIPILESSLSDQELIEFFRSPEGYRYALMDTMMDLVCDFVGALVFCVFGVATTDPAHFEKYANLVQFHYLNDVYSMPKNKVNSRHRRGMVQELEQEKEEKIEIEEIKKDEH